MSVRPLIVDAVIPARDAAATLAEVVAALGATRRLRAISIVDRASSDATSQIGRDLGALVLRAPAGLGAACLVAQEHLAKLPAPPDAVAFVPGDAPKDAARVGELIAALEDQGAELAIGGRGRKVPVSERALVKLIDTVYGHRFHGLGPTRVIRFPALIALGMSDRGNGWDIEMLVRSLRLGLTIVEVPISAEHGSRSPTGRSLFHILRHATVR